VGSKRPPLARRWPSGLNATFHTSLVCPWRVSNSRSVSASHTLISPEPEGPGTSIGGFPAPAIRRPSGLKATLGPPAGRVWSSCPVSASHTLISPFSHDVVTAALARRLPSGLKATLLILPTFPLYVTISRPVCASHT